MQRLEHEHFTFNLFHHEQGDKVTKMKWTTEIYSNLKGVIEGQRKIK